MNRASLAVFAVFAVALPAAVLVACDESSAVKERVPDAASTSTAPTPTTTSTTPIVNPDAGPDAPTDCFLNPTTHFEIINACTSAVKITKNPSLAKLLPDGGLPPLP